jgi:hypothetical protein
MPIDSRGRGPAPCPERTPSGPPATLPLRRSPRAAARIGFSLDRSSTPRTGWRLVELFEGRRRGTGSPGHGHRQWRGSFAACRAQLSAPEARHARGQRL